MSRMLPSGVRSGFTLIEILIALSVLVVGLVGILALFPVGIRASRMAVEDTSATILAQSVQASIIFSVDQANPGDPIDYYHDGVPSGVTFDLPAAGATVDVPAQASGAGSLEVFRVSQPASGAGDPNNFGGVDEEDRLHYGQYGFNFTVRGSTDPNLANLFEFIVHIYRNHQTGGKNLEPVLTFNFQHGAARD